MVIYDDESKTSPTQVFCRTYSKTIDILIRKLLGKMSILRKSSENMNVLSDEKSNKSKASSKKDTQQSTTARKRNKKKKKNLEKLENDELRSLAFGKPGKHKVNTNAHSHIQETPAAPVKQWEEWKKTDTEVFLHGLV
ncbi:hypothetical protein NP493_310g02019 [Ridgeia piscesae]|uniref:Uncharacterized protein n=1 Tax=Ridgeia piscesae TaxID=27915 RepID=A0AAD9NV31_RIDPI|nr:hypothetical protein NP493_310g02019 [Ridgeia piscesae]